MPKDIFITKASGERELFRSSKLHASLVRSGATEGRAQEIVDHILEELDDTWDTAAIYRHAFRLLKKGNSVIASRYSLKRAIMGLGPSGFPFERFVGLLLEHQGYRVKVDTQVAGTCVRHEVDVIGTTTARVIMVECKYHNQPGITTDVKVALATYARFLDVKDSLAQNLKYLAGTVEPWLVTNTRCSSDAIQYSECVGLRVVGWRYPEGASLEHIIETVGLYPITCLTTLTRTHVQTLLAQGIILCQDLAEKPGVFRSVRVSGSLAQKTLAEARELCRTNTKSQISNTGSGNR